MLAKRIIPCLDVKDGMTVKGVNFVNITEIGDPLELGEFYAREGADELVFLDITATHEKRKTMLEWVKKVARSINIPFTVGGGISSIDDVSALLDTGADKISVNSAAFKNPKLIDELSLHFGSQCIVLAVDTKFENGDSFVYLNGGRLATGAPTLPWIKEAVERGAGEILLTSINADGTKNGFALEVTRQVSELVNVPIIASGGAGTVEHFADVFKEGKADAALAASIFHRKEITIKEVKDYLHKENIPVRV